MEGNLKFIQPLLDSFVKLGSVTDLVGRSLIQIFQRNKPLRKMMGSLLDNKLISHCSRHVK